MVKLEEDEEGGDQEEDTQEGAALEGVGQEGVDLGSGGQVIGTIKECTLQEALEETKREKQAKYPPPPSMPPRVPASLTCPSNMNPTAVGILHGTILVVRVITDCGGVWALVLEEPMSN